jgi:hypothetical protein
MEYDAEGSAGMEIPSLARATLVYAISVLSVQTSKRSTQFATVLTRADVIHGINNYKERGEDSRCAGMH